jgi:hypothetical protein
MTLRKRMGRSSTRRMSRTSIASMVRKLQSARNLLREDVQLPEARLVVAVVAGDVVQEAAADADKRTPFPRKRTRL